MKKVIRFTAAAALFAAGAAALVFAAVQAVYWLNLDNKVMFLLHRILNRITDRVPRDRRF